MTAVRDFREELMSRDGNFAVLSAEQCHTFREYIRAMETAVLQSVCRDYECLSNRTVPRMAELTRLSRSSTRDLWRSVTEYAGVVPMSPDRHINDDVLGLHALGRTVRNGEAAAVDEHLLVCQECRERLDAEREYAGVMRQALWIVAGKRRK